MNVLVHVFFIHSMLNVLKTFLSTLTTWTPQVQDYFHLRGQVPKSGLDVCLAQLKHKNFFIAIGQALEPILKSFVVLYLICPYTHTKPYLCKKSDKNNSKVQQQHK